MKLRGFYQAFSVAAYCLFVAAIMFNADKIFGGDNNQQFFGPATFLLLFSTSALVCGLLVFLQPIKLFFKGKRDAAINLIVATTVWMFLFLTIILLANIFLHMIFFMIYKDS